MTNDANPLNRLRAEIKAGQATPKVAKGNHTLYLSEDRWAVFKRQCEQLGVTPSTVVDKLIAAWLAED